MEVNIVCRWQLLFVKSPNLPAPVPVIVAKDVPYVIDGNRMQNLSIYVPITTANKSLIDQPVTSLPQHDASSPVPSYHVHIHGGAWRDPNLTSTSIEATVAHAFASSPKRDDEAASNPIKAVVSLNYTITHFPTHPILPYDTSRGDHWDRAREAVHPMHIRDALHGFELLRALGLADKSYILTGHSCGACLSLQTIFRSPSHWGLDREGALSSSSLSPPVPAAFMGLNGLYDLSGLVHALGTSHEHLANDYQAFIGNAFGTDQSKWPDASPASFPVDELSARLRRGQIPSLVVLDQSPDDQLVPVSQTERLERHFKQVDGLEVFRGHHCTGRHAACWEEGDMIWDGIKDVLKLLSEEKA